MKRIIDGHNYVGGNENCVKLELVELMELVELYEIDHYDQ